MTDERVARLNEFGHTRLPGMLGMEILTCTASEVTGRIPVTAPLIAGTGFLWAPRAPMCGAAAGAIGRAWN